MIGQPHGISREAVFDMKYSEGLTKFHKTEDR